MIIDKLENMGRYEVLHPLFAKAFEFLKDAGTKPLGKYEIDGDSLYVNISENDLRSGGDMEAHRKYVDIQLVLEGTEKFKCAPLSQCRSVSKEYDENSDIMFFSDSPVVEYSAQKGTVSVFFPEDAHAPLIGEGRVRKAIAKVRL